MSKLVVLGISGVLGIITTRLIIQNFGVASYAQYGLLTSMTSLVPFADLGMAAVIMNTVAGSRSAQSDPTVRKTITSALRVLLTSAFVLIAIAVLLSVFGLWPAVLGAGLESGAPTAALLCVGIFAITLPLGVGQSILTGLGKNHLWILIQGIAAPLTLLLVAIMVATSFSQGNYVAVAVYIATMIVVASAFFLASRSIRPQVRAALASVPHVRSQPGVKTMNIAWPMLVQMIALPIAMQTDRLLLSHLGSQAELAQYNLGAQLYGMIIQTIGAAGVALWPIFAKARARSELKSPTGLSLGFLLGGLGAASILTILLPWVTPIISGGRITLTPWLVAGFIALVAGTAAKYPLGMYMTDARGLRFQVAPILVLVPVNLALSWWLIGVVGAAGPVLGSAISVILCQALPNLWYVRRDLARRRAEAAERVALAFNQSE